MSSRTAALVATALVSAALPAQAREPAAIPPAALRQAYLACERAATSDRMETGGIMGCSAIYEELKRREFGGDFGKLRRWSDPLLGRVPQHDPAMSKARLF